MDQRQYGTKLRAKECQHKTARKKNVSTHTHTHKHTHKHTHTHRHRRQDTDTETDTDTGTNTVTDNAQTQTQTHIYGPLRHSNRGNNHRRYTYVGHIFVGNTALNTWRDSTGLPPLSRTEMCVCVCVCVLVYFTSPQFTTSLSARAARVSHRLPY